MKAVVFYIELLMVISLLSGCCREELEIEIGGIQEERSEEAAAVLKDAGIDVYFGNGNLGLVEIKSMTAYERADVKVLFLSLAVKNQWTCVVNAGNHIILIKDGKVSVD